LNLGDPSGAGREPIFEPEYGEMALSDKGRDAFLIMQSDHISDAMEGLTLPRTVPNDSTCSGKPVSKLAQQVFSQSVEQMTIQHRRENAKCTIS
jgi:hypothetical protein